MIKIDKNKCIGCGACVSICSEGIEIVNGKAEIKDPNSGCIKDTISICPVNAIK